MKNAIFGLKKKHDFWIEIILFFTFQVIVTLTKTKCRIFMPKFPQSVGLCLQCRLNFVTILLTLYYPQVKCKNLILVNMIKSVWRSVKKNWRDRFVFCSIKKTKKAIDDVKGHISCRLRKNVFAQFSKNRLAQLTNMKLLCKINSIS